MRPERQRRPVTVKTVQCDVHTYMEPYTLFYKPIIGMNQQSHILQQLSFFSLLHGGFYIYCFSFKMFLLSSFLLFHFIVPSIYIFFRFFFCVFISLPSFYCSYFCSLSLALTRRKCAVHITSDLLTDFTFSELG